MNAGKSLPRQSIAIALIMFFATVLAARILFLHTVGHAFYRMHGATQWFRTIRLMPPRAPVYDRHGTALALTVDTYAACIFPRLLRQKEKVEQFLAKHAPKTLATLQESTEQLPHFLYVARRLTNEQVQALSQEGPEDIHIITEPGRWYTVAAALPVVGVAGIDGKGLSGIEYTCNKLLSGTACTYALQREGRSPPIYTTRTVLEAGVAPQPVTLTIDARLQQAAFEAVQEAVTQVGSEMGAAIIMEPNTGEILALVTYPCGDPNDSSSLTPEHLGTLTHTYSFELGSVIKPFIALAALDAGVVTPEEPIDCENRKVTYLDGQRIGTYKADGILSFSQVIYKSNNIGTSKVAKRLGAALFDHYCLCGFGKQTGIQLPGESPGFVNPPKQWTKPSIFSLSFGYEMRATLIQLACAFCMLANYGQPIRPHLIRSPHLVSDRPQPPSYPRQTTQAVLDMLEKTILDGTAHQAALSGCIVRGKTGTANLVVDGHYDRNQNIFTFAGIIEQQSTEGKQPYKRVIVTFLKKARKKNIYASSTATPLFKAIAERMLAIDGIAA